MSLAFEFQNVTKKLGDNTALDDVSVSVPDRSIVGLVGRNGSGKTTLLRHITGLYLPTSGSCVTLGCSTPQLEAIQLAQIGVVNQHDSFIGWMRAGKFIRYIASFYERWDRDLENQLISTFDVDLNARLGTMSPGNVQKIGLVVATCHHPRLLLLDEPLSDLDPIARSNALQILLDLFRDDEMTIVISSHMLYDLEKLIDRVIVLDYGRVLADASLDDLKERYAEWIVRSPRGALPDDFAEPFVIEWDGDSQMARLDVLHSERDLAAFKSTHDVEVEVRALNLERIFPLITRERKRVPLSPYHRARAPRGVSPR